ncbi:protoporphyrinogen oxidase [Deferribacteraceae bacterium V6Fe1]|nr:protoporphyrinogen oxidase [Deferribacteraceae bacterium V6Fe1]
MKIAIIGGGISGVSAAFWLSKSLSECNKDFKIILYEKNSKLGGSIDTVTNGDFTVEAGPNGFLDSKPYTLKLVEDAGVKNKLYKSNDLARKRFIMRYGRLIRLPEKPPQFFKTDLLTLKGKLRVVAEYFIPQRILEDETVADFARRRLGEEACDYLISPMVSGIFAGDPEKMSLRACFPVIYDLEVNYGGLFKGMLKKRGKKSGPAGPGGVLTSYSGGLINLINDVIDKCINVEVRLNSPVDNIIKNNEKFEIVSEDEKENFDYIIMTCPSYEASKMTKSLNENLSKEFSNIPYAPAFVVGLGFEEKDVEDKLDGFGYLIPAKENRKILGALFTSSIFPERVKNGKKLVRVIMGGDRNRWILDKSDEELLDIAFNEIKDTLKIKNKPESRIFFRWEKAIPQYYIGHLKAVKNIEDIADSIGNFYVGGNILYGVGINDCTKRSYDIVEKFMQNIK